MKDSSVPRSKVVSHERFLMFRSAVELQRAAEGLRAMTAAFEHFNDVVDTACEEARASLIQAEETLAEQSGRAAKERSRTLGVLAEGDLDAMVAERDRLLAAERRDCRHCDDYQPAADSFCGRDPVACPRDPEH